MSYSEKELRDILGTEIERMDFSLVDMKLNASGKYIDLKLFVDRENGITIKECSEISRSISDLIFKKDLLPKDYNLEVSSPGLDRALTSARDFRKNIGKDISLEYNVDNDIKNIEGKIFEVSDDIVIIESKKESFSIPVCSVINGKIKLKW